MKALISPNEFVLDGARVAQVAQEPFEVAQPLFWVDCPAECTPENAYYIGGAVTLIPIEPPTLPPETSVEVLP